MSIQEVYKEYTRSIQGVYKEYAGSIHLLLFLPKYQQRIPLLDPTIDWRKQFSANTHKHTRSKGQRKST